jgi:hypothetical protein
MTGHYIVGVFPNDSIDVRSSIRIFQFTELPQGNEAYAQLDIITFLVKQDT